MRGTLTLLLIFASAAGAAPLAQDTPPRAPVNPQEARAFAQQVIGIVHQVAGAYVRQVPRHELFYAALSGLYESAGLPVPEDLRAELGEKIKDPASSADMDLEMAVQRMADSEALLNVIARERQRVGNPPAFQGPGALRSCLEALTRSLDPYCAVIDHREMRRTQGEQIHLGTGIELAGDGPAGVLIKAVAPGSPAQRAGLRPGDQITHLFGKPVAEHPAGAIALHVGDRRMEPPGSAAVPIVAVESPEITVLPVGKDETRRLKLERAEYRPETVSGVQRCDGDTWDHMLDAQRKIAYIRVGALEHGTAEDVQQALTRLKADGMRGLILDLRWCPGGFLTEAIWIARLFLEKGIIATVESRRPQDQQVYKADADGAFLNFPIVVLVNTETMGGAELIAAALQDNKRATVAGQRSFGKGSVQTVLTLPYPEMGLKLTSGSFLRPSGKGLNRFPDSRPADDWGVRPEPGQETRLSSDLSSQLKDWYLLHTLRPGGSAEALPLDDPEKDPQRQQALMALRAKLGE
jgi:C-terminal peptidase prc